MPTDSRTDYLSPVLYPQPQPDSIFISPTNINYNSNYESVPQINFVADNVGRRDNILAGSGRKGADCDENGERCNYFV
jgi:hypothetical protein